MIQAPQQQYIPMQQPVQTVPTQQGAVNSTNITQTPGVIYNYPTGNYYPAQQPYNKSQYNGVNIEILNPQGQGGALQAPAASAPAVMPAQYFPVQQPVIIPPYQAPMQQPAVQEQVPAQTPVQAPAPQIPQATQPQAPVVEQPASQTSDVNPETFAGRLRTDDLEAQKTAIKDIAETVKNNEQAGPALLDTKVVDALVEVIDKDTSNLEGPSPEVLELRQKPQEELSEQDKAKASAPSPLEDAEINKQYALYTISYIQERLNKELEKRNSSALELKDLPAIEKVVDTAKSNPNPMLRIGAIAALSHIARPEYKEDLNTIFELAKSDEDERVKEAASKAIDALNGTAPAAAAETNEEAPKAEDTPKDAPKEETKEEKK